MFIEYSLWWIIPIVIIAILGSFILYFFPKRKCFSKKKIIILSIIRFLALFLSLFLILSPTQKQKKTIIKRPLIVICQDNSSSILMSKYKNYYQTDYLESLDKLSKDLEKDYDIQRILFADEVKEISNQEIKSIKFDKTSTDISNLISKIEDKYSNLNLCGVILASDGIINKGKDPLNLVSELNVPIFTLAMGDTTVKTDVSISEIRHNRLAFLKNQFPVEIIVQAKKSNGSQSIVKIIKDGKTLFEQSFRIDNENFSKKFQTTLLADKVGLSKYRIEVKPIQNEQTTANNSRDIFVEVLDSRQKVLILANSPHPDISAIKQSIKENQNYEVETYLFGDLPSTIKDYDLVILHQIPSLNILQKKQIEKFIQQKTPLLFVIGSQTNLSILNSLNLGLRITTDKTTLNQTLASLNNNFTLFTLTEQAKTILSQLPPLQSPFGKYEISPSSQSLFYQKFGTIPTENPQIAFTTDNMVRNGFIIGEGFFLWRLQNFHINQSHQQTDEIIQKTVQYLASNIDRKPFRVISDQVFAENQQIILSAELYNQSYELVNEPEVKLIITNSQNIQYPFAFSRTENAYHINLGAYPAGKYRYIATTNLGSKAYKEEGEFYVSSKNLEQINLVADHNLLFNISEQTNGVMLYPNETQKLRELISKQKNIKPIAYQTITNSRFIDEFWYLFMIIFLFSAEWFLRKYWLN